MEKSYDHRQLEKRIYQEWESNNCFTPDQSRNKTYLITMPPPNVTGVLHNGHALFVSLQDTYIRWQRMRGKNALWVPGTDHAGIATQLMVERLLESQGTSRREVGREKFLDRTWQWKEEHSGMIQQQFRAMGSSCDWSRERFTMDEKSSRAVRESFIRLFKEKLIYRGERMVNWSYGLQTAVSDLEVEMKTTNGFMHHIAYPLADGSGELVIATTRPETMFADVAVAVNPNDERYKAFHGKTLILPLSKREIPIICDEYVDLEFGTGCLKVTPGHDSNDWEIGQRHNLETLSVINREGKMTDAAGEFAGQFATKARKLVSDKLDELGFLRKKEKYTYEQGFCQRSGVPIEPIVSLQWWVKASELAKDALKAAKGDQPALRFYPDHWKKTYFEWMENIQDWCISRQLWWGHQIPIWHCQACSHMMVPENADANDPHKCEKCGSEKLEQDPDVLDTWYSSGLWPITTLGWPDNSQDLQTYYPTTRFDQAREKGQEIRALMETGSDIIFFWVARMMMMCTHFMQGRIPFEDVYLHAMVRDEKGQKMSKTKGNVIDPMDIIAEHGADALRLTLLALSGQGRSVNFDMNRLEGYKAFINKVWNATRFTLMNFTAKEKSADFFVDEIKELNWDELSLIDKWILHRLNAATKIVNESLENYRADTAFNAIYQFAWYEFCDWYLEMSKIHLADEYQELGTHQYADNTLRVLYVCLSKILHLLHPLAPFATEELFRQLPGKSSEILMMRTYPLYNNKLAWTEAEQADVELLQNTVEGFRNFVTENRIHPKKTFEVYLETKNKSKWQELASYISVLSKIQTCHINSKAPAGPAGSVNTKDFHFTIPLADLVDKEAEIKRLGQEIAKLDKDLEKVNKKLENKSFVERAKPEVVEVEKNRQKELLAKKSALQTALNEMQK